MTPDPDQSPTLALVSNAVRLVRSDEPFAVPPDVFERARVEMEAIARDRGFPLPQDEMLRRRGVPHFLVHGKPVIEARALNG